MLPSMSRPGNPYDNATCESFLKTLKREEIHATTYRDFEDLLKRLEEFIERYYNRCRLHSALGHCSPSNFEDEATPQQGPALQRGDDIHRWVVCCTSLSQRGVHSVGFLMDSLHQPCTNPTFSYCGG